jgi:large subunit ribosomal protein L10
MPTAEKEKVIAEMRDELQNAKGVLLADFSGMDVATVTALRNALRANGVQYKVIKNTLLRIACKDRGLESLEPYLEGPTAIAYSTTSEVEPVRVIVEFAKKHERPAVKAGVIGERFYDKSELQRLAALPSREELLSQVLATVIAPLSGFLGSINALLAAPATLAGELEKKQGGA